MGETVAKTVRKKTANAGMFSKERPRAGPGRGHKNPEARMAAAKAVEEMDQAYSGIPDKEDSVGVVGARKLAKEDYPKFIQLYVKMRELAGYGDGDAKAEKEAQVAAAATGGKEERVEELANRLLDEWGKSDAGTHSDGRRDEETE